MWMIDRTKDKGWLGRLQDGEWIPATELAYTKYDNSGQYASQDRAMNNAPVVPPETNIPEYVEQSIGEEVDIPYEYR